MEKFNVPVEAEELWKEQIESRFPLKDSLKDLLGRSISPIEKTYSSKGMKKSEILDYLITQTENLLFGKRDDRFRDIIYADCENDDESLELLSRFIIWKDIDKS